MKTENRKSKPEKFAWFKGVWSVVLLAVSLTAQTALAEPTAQDIKDLKADLENYTVQYEKKVNTIIEKHRKLFPYAEIHDRYLKAKEGTKFTASREGLFGYKTLVQLAYKFAYDEVKGKATASSVIAEALELHYAKPICDALRIYLQWKTDLYNELYEADEEYLRVFRERIVKFSAQVRKGTDPSLDRWEFTSGGLEKRITQLNHKKNPRDIWEGVGLDDHASETKCRYELGIYYTLERFSIALSAITKKMSDINIVDIMNGAMENLRTGAPLPLVDITDTKIVLDGEAWTAEEIYKMTETAQKDYVEWFDGETDMLESLLLDNGYRHLLENERDVRQTIVRSIKLELDTRARGLRTLSDVLREGTSTH